MSTGKKALLIENTAIYPPSLRLLAEEGYRVDTWHHADFALPRLDVNPYDVIIVQEHPEAESWQLCKKIRYLSAAPLIVISTHASAETSARAIQAGADCFMRKPFGPLEFRARLHALQRQRATLVS